MTEQPQALWWAKARSAGPLPVALGTAVPTGMLRLTEPDAATAWLLPVLPDGATPSVLDELGLPGPAVEHPNDTARVLAACVRCCWLDQAGPLWPSSAASLDEVATVFGATTGREPMALNRALLGAIRRLAGAGWLLWDEANRWVRLGPRVATWSPAELSTLRELCRWALAGARATDTGSDHVSEEGQL